MTSNDLKRAVEPVRSYHHATEPTVNTVLAAYLRSQGMPANGAAWAVAKKALGDGLDFVSAVAVAAGSLSDQRRVSDSPTAPAEHRTQTSGATVWRPPLSPETNHAPRTPPTAPQAGPSPGLTSPNQVTALPGRPAPPAEGDRSALGRPPSAGAPAQPSMRLRGDSSGLTGEPLPTLEWFPKVYGPGDIDGTGTSKLLGTPHVPLSTVLVRETAQNSWDARLGTGAPVHFSLHLRRLSDTERHALASHVLTGDGPKLGLSEALQRPDLWVLEVSDRGTKGLGGPVRNDEEPELGVPTNYIDLVLNVGAPRDVHLGGGTYGFGKTVSYRVSGSGSVVIWSRSREGAEGEIEDRLIGSAIGSSFARSGLRYTGRHWWGVVKDNNQRVEPVVGKAAAALASRVFQSTFNDAQTGTSLMIVDPDLGGENRSEDAQRLADAVLWNLWPKMVKDHDGAVPMNIELLFDGTPFPLPDIESHPAISGYVDCLQLVRATQQEFTYTPRFNTEVFEIRSHRPIELLGHLAISRYSFDPRATTPTEIAPYVADSSHVALMRNEAELVVKYDQGPSLDTEGLQWAGVFKPTADVDDAFASAEPPAHDDWIPNAIEERADKLRVNVGLRRVREQVKEFLAPAAAQDRDGGPRRSTAALADSLSRLVGGVRGSAPSQRKASTSRKSSPKATAKILQVVRGEAVDGWRELLIRVSVNDAEKPVTVVAKAGIGVEGTVIEDDSQVEVLGWSSSGEEGVLDADAPQLRNQDEAWLLIRARHDVAVEIDLNTRMVD